MTKILYRNKPLVYNKIGCHLQMPAEGANAEQLSFLRSLHFR